MNVMCALAVFIATVDAEDTTVATIILFVCAIPLAIWGLSVQARRCHDIGQSAWILLLQIPFIGSLILYLLLGFKDGTPGPNQFGPDPKGRDPSNWKYM